MICLLLTPRFKAMSHLWLVCYDVANNKRRQKLAKRMERVCQRVQESVFECPLDEAGLAEQLERFWLPVLDVREDSLRAYPLDGRTKQRVKVYGSPPPYEPPDFVIL
jgi:CRISPR-associated protein Cas2